MWVEACGRVLTIKIKCCLAGLKKPLPAHGKELSSLAVSTDVDTSLGRSNFAVGRELFEADWHVHAIRRERTDG